MKTFKNLLDFRYKKLFAFIIIACILFMSACSSYNINSSKQTMGEVSSGEKLKVHYIDVGQGDSILIQQGTANMLIDTGTNESTDRLLKYLQDEKIDKLDYLILTHPHEDHIGGADAIINKYKINNLYMPKITANTKTFKDTVSAIKKNGLTASQPKVGDNFKLGDADCKVLGPINSDKENLNTYSIAIKITFGENKFLFTGDSEASNEADMIKAGLDLSADVLKVGHHGSSTSTSKEFLEKVNPKYAVISCGKGNDYGHPHKETMNKLKNKNVTVYRTDESGTIVCTSDGKNISFNVKPGDYKPGR
ncbi:MBL fold metallo-hydrolase [Clostridium sp. 19966]|uniref:ComEC/Rec2 family competence protein n=1 Tax=Clostridium sp. 19966 TaxID=2768166 RepID=UPI0028DDEB01|nr:ComEC/Rec2 family competence protein [Clostridium sp. 19966]MDT8719391.1 MBL fold metallo-hydrolase [Clostridium sp. 19966]